MFNFATIVVLVTAVSALPTTKLTKRDVATVLANLETINADTLTLTSTITSWDSSLLGALGISSETTTLDDDIRSATTEALTESQADDADTETVLDYITGTLVPNLEASLTALTSREADFDALGLNPTVLSILQNLQTDIDALDDALYDITATDEQSAAVTVGEEIDDDFASAILVFS